MDPGTMREGREEFLQRTGVNRIVLLRANIPLRTQKDILKELRTRRI